jgi:hypothetical protein
MGGVIVLYEKVLKFSIPSVLCAFPDSVPASVSGVSESELMFCCRRGLFWSFGLLSLFNG